MTRPDFPRPFDPYFDGCEFDVAVRGWPTEHDPSLWTFDLEEPLRVHRSAGPRAFEFVPAPQAPLRQHVRGFKSAAASGARATTAGRPCPNVLDFAGLKLCADPLPVTLGHVTSHVIGHASRVVICEAGVIVEGAIWLRTQHADLVLAQEARGVEWQSSVVVEWTRVEHVPAGETASVNGVTIEGPVEIVREGRLLELGLTTIPADPSTVVLFNDAKPGAVDGIREKLRAQGALERVALIEAWELMRPETRRRSVDVVLEAVEAPQLREDRQERPSHYTDAQLHELQSSGDMDRALMFHYWNQLPAAAQAEIVGFIRADLAPGSTAQRGVEEVRSIIATRAADIADDERPSELEA